MIPLGRRCLLKSAALGAAFAIGVSAALHHGASSQSIGTDQHSPGAEAGSSATDWLRLRPVGIVFDPTPENRPVINATLAGGAAARAGLEPGDVVLQLGDRSASSPDEAARAIRVAWSSGKSAIDLTVSRAGQVLYVALALRP